MQRFKQNEATAARRYFKLHLVDASDGITAETGEAGGQPQISTNGAEFVSTSATLTAIGNGAYYVALTENELGTLGDIIVRYKSANTAEFQDLAYVVSYDPYDAAGLGLALIDAAISTRAAEEGGNVAGIKAKTDNLPSDPADESLLEAALAAIAALIPGDLADIPTAAELIVAHGEGSWVTGGGGGGYAMVDAIWTEKEKLAIIKDVKYLRELLDKILPELPENVTAKLKEPLNNLYQQSLEFAAKANITKDILMQAIGTLPPQLQGEVNRAIIPLLNAITKKLDTVETITLKAAPDAALEDFTDGKKSEGA